MPTTKAKVAAPAPLEQAPVEPVPTTNVSVGPSTVLGGGITVAAYAGAIAAFATGHHDAETIELLATGTVSLVATLLGRYAQAVAAIKALAASLGGGS